MVPERCANLSKVLQRQLAVFPEHGEYLAKRFADADEADLEFSDQVAGMVLQIAGAGLDRICEDYRWLNAIVLEEELYFRRHNSYRLSSFADAVAQVYSNADFMSRYMNGLLASQLWWRNHTDVLRFFRDRFIGQNPKGFTHLEIGPGHGLFLSLAASAAHCGSAEGWDISDASLAGTEAALRAMHAPLQRIRLNKIDLFEGPAASFQSITFSEVLEHLEDPRAALKALHRLLAGGGRIFINAPVNSPAPDHLYLFRQPEEVSEMVREAGFEVVESLFAPCTGASLQRARKLNLTISAAVVAVKSV